MTPTEALARALQDLLDAADKHAKFGSYPGVEEWDDAYDKAVLLLASIHSVTAEAADREAADELRQRNAAPTRGTDPSAAADLDPEALAHAMLASGIRCEPEYPTTLDAARVLAAAYAAAREAK